MKTIKLEISFSMMNLPLEIIIEIIVKLPIKGILSCKFVCKTWRDLISSPGFVKLHMSQAKPCLLLNCKHEFSRSLCLIDHNEFEDLRRSDLNLVLCRCSCDLRGGCNECDGVDFNSLQRLSLCNARSMLDFEYKFRKEFYRPEEYMIVNSCNGLLCLVKPWFKVASENLAVCNPITGEFMFLPRLRDYEKYEAETEKGQYFYVYGLGFSPRTGRYKVIVIQFARHLGSVVSRVDIHTVGTKSWERISDFGRPFSASDNLKCFNYQCDNFPTYIDGTLYWLIDRTRYSNCILCFDFDDNKFRSYSLLLNNQQGSCQLGRPNLVMGVLGGDLCVRNKYYHRRKICIDVWVKKKHDKVWKRWNVLFSPADNLKGLVFRLLKPTRLFSSPLIMFHFHPQTMLMHHDGGFVKFKQLEIYHNETEIHFIAHIPSFISLNDIVMRERRNRCI